MKTCIALIAILVATVCANENSSDVERDLLQLRKVALAVCIYMEANDGHVPSNLEPLRNYIDVARMLNAVPGSKIELTERYSFLATKPTINLPGAGDIQVLLLGVRPEKGRRMAIWIGKDGLPDTGMLLESELIAAAANKIDLKGLRPMDGVVPKASEKVLAVAEPSGMTVYQTRVLTPAPQGEIKSDLQYHPGSNQVLPSNSGAMPTTMSSPTKSMDRPPIHKTNSIVYSTSSPMRMGGPTGMLAIIAITLAGGLVLLIRRKSR